jgi:SAM-dependent methyltransferase
MQQADGESATRALSFGGIAEDYDRFRPGPPDSAVDWVLPSPCTTALDLGAGTGTLTRKLLERAIRVVAVDLDPRMMAVLSSHSPGAAGMLAQAELLPLGAGMFDSVVVSSAWHWMDTEQTVSEIARVLRHGGAMGVVWNGPDRSVEWVGELLGRRDPSPGDRARGDRHHVELPPGSLFDGIETCVITWSLPMTLAELVGLAGTYSSVITLPPDRRTDELDGIRERLENILAVRDDSVVELPMSCRCWRASRR